MKEYEDIIPFIRGSDPQFACIYRIQIDGIAMPLVQRVKSRPRTTVARVRYQYSPRGYFDKKTGFIFFFWPKEPTVGQSFSFTRFLLVDHTQRRITVGRTPLDE